MAESPISKLSNQYHEWYAASACRPRFRDAIGPHDAGVIFDASRRASNGLVEGEAKAHAAARFYTHPGRYHDIVGVRQRLYPR